LEAFPVANTQGEAFFMAWLRAENLMLQAGDRQLVQGATFRIDPGDRIGLVGPNGMGKTTLFRVLAGDRLPDGGFIERSADLTVASLDQLHPVNHPTVWETASRANQQIPALASELRTLEAAMADPAVADLDAILARYADVQEHFERLGGYTWEARVRQALEGAGLPESRDHDHPGVLSGGERHRLALVQVVLSGADLWLLDEPTNHLDVEAMEWLERTLTAFSGGVLMASHDRRFLERTATRIMTWEDGFFWLLGGGYRQYQRLRQERSQRVAEEWARYQEERARLQSYVDRYREGNRATMAKSRLHAIARLDRQAVARPARASTAPGRLSHGGRELSGTLALIVDGLTLQRGARVWDPIQFKLPVKACLGVVGPNGSGKTTLMRALAESAPGVRWNPDAVVSWYDQEAAGLLPEDATGIGLAHEEGMDRETAYHLGARFGLRRELLDGEVGKWSGGERSRLALLFALMSRSSVLLLDEPTNHLDLRMREELESLLSGYPGALIIVSHDRELLDNLCTHTLWWRDGRFHFAAGTFSAVQNISVGGR
jgi:ATP-binding cassette subfamily F protein 3